VGEGPQSTPLSLLVKRDSSGCGNLPGMSPEFQPGIRFEWHYTVPDRATVPRLYHDTPFCLDMPEVLATGYMVGMKLAGKLEKVVS
jgi:hypothetical protein